MLIGPRQIDDDLHLIIGKGIMHCFVDLGNTVFGLGFFCLFPHKITYTNDFDLPEYLGQILQVNPADVPDPYDGHLCPFHTFSPHILYFE